jgi:hypothetical protein
MIKKVEVDIMGRLYIPADLTDKEEAEFREKAFRAFKGRKGFLKEACRAALLKWDGTPINEDE